MRNGEISLRLTNMLLAINWLSHIGGLLEICLVNDVALQRIHVDI